MQAIANATLIPQSPVPRSIVPGASDPRQMSDAPALNIRDVHKQLERAAAAADRKVYRRFKTLDGLLSTLADEAFSEVKAKTRVSVLETAAEESDIALQQALYDAKMVLAGNADVVARGGTVSYDMEDAELETHQRTARAARDARASLKMVQDARRVVEECHEQVEISSRIARKCEVAYLAAQRVATHLKDKADRVGETLRAVPEGRGVAPLPVATRVGVVEGGRVSSCDNEQVHTYTRVCIVLVCFCVGTLARDASRTEMSELRWTKRYQ